MDIGAKVVILVSTFLGKTGVVTEFDWSEGYARVLLSDGFEYTFGAWELEELPVPRTPVAPTCKPWKV
jgi:hypothetical protein